MTVEGPAAMPSYKQCHFLLQPSPNACQSSSPERTCNQFTQTLTTLTCSTTNNTCVEEARSSLIGSVYFCICSKVNLCSYSDVVFRFNSHGTFAHIFGFAFVKQCFCYKFSVVGILRRYTYYYASRSGTLNRAPRCVVRVLYACFLYKLKILRTSQPHTLEHNSCLAM